MITKYIFIRHAESQKNLRDITGGTGESLTVRGQEQAHMLALKLKHAFPCAQIQTISSNTIQAIETCKYIAEEVESSVIVDHNLKQAFFGVLSGLSTQEIKTSHPAEYELLQKWRNREIDVTKLKIPGIEPPLSVWNRMMTFLKCYCKNEVNIVICTRSIMVLIYNYVHNNLPIPNGGYLHVNVNNCDAIAFEYSNNSIPIIDTDLTTVQ